MSYLNASELGPWQSQGEDCPFDCVGCEHLIDVHMNSDHSVEIECGLKE